MVDMARIKVDDTYRLLYITYKNAARELRKYENANGIGYASSKSLPVRIATKRNYLIKLYKEAQTFAAQAAIAATQGNQAQQEHYNRLVKQRVYTANHHSKVLAKLEQTLKDFEDDGIGGT